MNETTDWTPVQTTLETGTNAALYTLAPRTPRALIHMNHGMAEHAGRYGRFARALCEAGYATIAQDHRGHGNTTATGATQGYFGQKDGWEKLCTDAEAVRALGKQRFAGLPVVTFGHSMGAILAINLAMRKPGDMAALAAWNGSVDAGALTGVLSGLLKVQKMFIGSDTPSRLAQSLTFDAWNKQFAPNRTNFDWLSRDKAEVDAYVADPLCGFPVSTGMWLDVLDGVTVGADDRNLGTLPKDLPVHLLGGEKDPATNGGKAITNIANRMAKAGMTDIATTILPDTRHESLNETNREETTQDFIAWLDRHFA